MTTLLGQSGAGTNTANSATSGTAETIRLTALATGTVDTVQFFFRTGSTSTNIRFAIYADSAGVPGARIGTEQVLAAPTANADNAIPGFNAAVVLGSSYWIAWLLPNGGGGVFQYADFAASGGTVKDSTSAVLTTLADPAPTYGSSFANIVRVYATGTAGAITGPVFTPHRMPLGV